MNYRLHYAPDNASLIIRLALDHIGQPFETVLVDRRAEAQRSPAYRALNPNGLIPTLETPHGPIFETGAIVLWLSEQHDGLAPGAQTPERGDFLKWLFFVSNTVHPSLRMMFYPEKYISAAAAPALRDGLAVHLRQSFRTLDVIAGQKPNWFGAANPTILDFYVGAILRWSAIYPVDQKQAWFDLYQYPNLCDLCAHLETLKATDILCRAEGLGPTPFTAPQYPNPPEGSAI